MRERERERESTHRKDTPEPRNFCTEHTRAHELGSANFAAEWSPPYEFNFDMHDLLPRGTAAMLLL
jgi:hypothetical protein